MIEKIGLKTLDLRDENLYVVSAFDLESILRSAQVVYCDRNPRDPKYEWMGEKEYESWKTTNKQMADGTFNTHSALLIGITPIKKKTKAEAALEFVEKFKSGMLSHVGYLEAEKEAIRILEMKD